ncbi:MAG: Ribonucleoside-diphosphate reductase [Parcubacteria group bacterium GW2011_GWF1_45_5]|nr:MAG: Ribonucleoside-diphosphate reductase [Parcubacteria group bacterium GW2011_GWF1_45_5]
MSQPNIITKIIKRDGRIVIFDQDKITQAIYRALRSVRETNVLLAQEVSDKVVEVLNDRFSNSVPGVEDIQDVVVSILSAIGYEEVARSYQEYREKRAFIREAKYWLLARDIRTKLSENSVKVLESRYLRKSEDGKILETAQELFKRVAHNIASAEKNFNPSITDDELFRVEEKFYRMMAQLEFLPNSPTLMNAGNYLQQLSACFVLPINDSLLSIFEALKQTALIHQSGGGTGFDFSHLRPHGDFVKTTAGVASGPISFMRIFDSATQEIKQGSFRRGANMGILRVDHPDILEFIAVKADNKTLQNFNISVAITNEFMEAYEKDEMYPLRNPRTGQVIEKLSARMVFDCIARTAWTTGDPGLLFIDRMNDERGNPVPSLGRIEATNPCGEIPMLAYESCNLGSINLNAVLKEEGEGKCVFDWDGFGTLVHNAVHFLDNVIEMSRYPLNEIDQATRSMRRIGLGIMGWADILMKLGIPYDAEEAYEFAGRLMKFVQDEARRASDELGKLRGPFPNYTYSIFVHTDRKPRNAALTTIAPTGTISVISDCSSGIEPIFALAYIRKARLNRGARDDKDEWVDLLEVNKTFEEIAKREGFYSEELMKKVALRGSVQGITEIPEHWRAVFKIAHDLKSEDHIRMQATFQKFVDNAVSKTVNFSNTASLEDVKKAYLLAWESGCKGITIYRDGSKEFQVLNLGFSQEPITVTTEEEDHRGENNIDETVSEAAVSIAYDQVPNTVIMAKDSGVCHNCD